MSKKSKLKKYFIIIAGILVASTLLILGEITYSRYYTKIDGIGNAQIARWAFKVNNEIQTIKDIKLNNTINTDKIEKNKIAPGSKGSFDIVIEAENSDVAIDYEIKFDNEQNKPTNLKFKYDGTTAADTLKELENLLKGRINANDTNKVITKTIEWAWDYETGTNDEEIANNDKIDTQDAGKDYTFDISVTGVQVNPNN